jgi:hypothetical protein
MSRVRGRFLLSCRWVRVNFKALLT